MPENPLLQKLKNAIGSTALIRSNAEETIIASSGNPDPLAFDLRSLSLTAEFLNDYAELFWEKFSHRYPFQVGGLESASISMIAAIVLKGQERGTPVNGFYIRKSRKPEGLQKSIEGNLTDEPVILVDDLINSGKTFVKQIEVLAKENKKVLALFALVHFRELQDYTFAHEAGIEVIAPFSLIDFGIKKTHHPSLPDHAAFVAQWLHTPSHRPSYFYRVPKSAPVIDTEKVYFGSDDGTMRALKQESGEEIWRYKILGLGAAGKTIFSSPALFNGTLYFGAYDGNFYALDARTGKNKWIYMDADWIGSSPCVAEDLGLVFVGLEYGLFKKHGGIVALDAKTGEKKWEYIDMPKYTHGSPIYSKKFNVVAIGSNDGDVYAFDAKKGNLIWNIQTRSEIKFVASDEKRGYIVCCSMDGNVYIVKIKTGEFTSILNTGVGIYAAPLIENDHVYISGLDKKIYCIQLDTFKKVWEFQTNGRVFASPALIDDHIYVGSNDGRLYEIDAKTGKNTAFFQTTERITNKIAYNAATKRFFLLTYANELYSLERKTHQT